MEGYALGARLLAVTAPRRPRLIALTGDGTEDDRAKSAAAGFTHHLVKPVEFERLFSFLS